MLSNLCVHSRLHMLSVYEIVCLKLLSLSAGSHLQAEALTTNVLGEHNRTTRSGRCFAEEDVKAPIVNPPPPSRKRQKLSQAAERQEASQRPPQLSKAAQQRDSAPQSRPASAKRAHIPEENLRTVRPRPLHIKDKVCMLCHRADSSHLLHSHSLTKDLGCHR